MECFLFKIFLCLRVKVYYVSLLVLFLSFITGLGQDFSCEEKSIQLSVEKANVKL